MRELGIDSPMFDYVEQIAGRSTAGGSGQSSVATKISREKTELERKKRQLQEKDDLEQVEAIQFEDNEDD